MREYTPDKQCVALPIYDEKLQAGVLFELLEL